MTKIASFKDLRAQAEHAQRQQATWARYGPVLFVTETGQKGKVAPVRRY
jgi:hypothetical protein